MAVEIVDGGFALDAESGSKKKRAQAGPKEGPVDKSSLNANIVLSSAAAMFGRFLNARERQSKNKGRSIQDLLSEYMTLNPDVPVGFYEVVLKDPELVDMVKEGYNSVNILPSITTDEFEGELPYHKNLDMESEPYESEVEVVDPLAMISERTVFNPFDLIRSKNLEQPSR